MGWAPETVLHTFATGRTARLRTALPMAVIRRRAVGAGDLDVLESLDALLQFVATMATRAAEGEVPALDDELKRILGDKVAGQRLSDAILRVMWVRPEISDAEEPTGPEDDPDTIPIDWVRGGEIDETFFIAFGGVAAAERFRELAGGARDGQGGDGVGSKPKRARRAAKRER